MSPHLISYNDARESVSYEDIFLTVRPQRRCLISQCLFVSHKSGTFVDDNKVTIILRPKNQTLKCQTLNVPRASELIVQSLEKLHLRGSYSQSGFTTVTIY